MGIPDGDERLALEPDDHRRRTERDRDRLLHCEYFWRLGDVTQVTRSTRKELVHNRQTHSIEVAQIANRIALKIKRDALAGEYRHIAHLIEDIDENACEVGALAHDIGHPPFGHTGESALDDCLKDESLVGRQASRELGYEGNAQSFRVVATLAQRDRNYGGLNLTRKSLNAILKYPSLGPSQSGVKATGIIRGAKVGPVAREAKPVSSLRARPAKYGAFHEDRIAFDFSREGMPQGVRSIEANIMDVADDIAYSVHDVLDYYKLGVIPLDRLLDRDHEWDDFREEVTHRRKRRDDSEFDWSRLESALREFLRFFIERPYDETFYARKRVVQFHGYLFGLFIKGAASGIQRMPDYDLLELKPSEEFVEQVEFLKEITIHYVHRHPDLQQARIGQKQLMRTVFERIYKEKKDAVLLPHRYREMMELGEVHRARVIADFLSGLTEAQVYILYDRLTGDSRYGAFD